MNNTAPNASNNNQAQKETPKKGMDLFEIPLLPLWDRNEAHASIQNDAYHHHPLITLPFYKEETSPF